VIDSFLIRNSFASGKRGAEEGYGSPPKKRKVSIVPDGTAQINVAQLPASRKAEPKAVFIHPVSIPFDFDTQLIVIERETFPRKVRQREFGKIQPRVKCSS